MHPVIESCALRDRAEFVSKREHTRLIDKSAHILTNKPTGYDLSLLGFQYSAVIAENNFAVQIYNISLSNFGKIIMPSFRQEFEQQD